MRVGNAKRVGSLRIVYRLTQGFPEAPGGLRQLTLEDVDLLRDRLKFLFGKHSCFCNLMCFAVRSTHGGTDSYGDSREPAFLGHLVLL